MPVKSQSERRLMQAAAHTKGGYGGVPQSVGREFVQADKALGKKALRKLPERVKKPKHRSPFTAA